MLCRGAIRESGGKDFEIDLARGDGITEGLEDGDSGIATGGFDTHAFGIAMGGRPARSRVLHKQV